MPDLAEWLQQLSDDELREFINRIVPAMQAAAQAELDARRPTARATSHGTGCRCCGAGVRQWR